MRTNIVLDDELVKKAFLLAPSLKTKKSLIDMALKEFIAVRTSLSIQKLKGENLFSDDYDYKAMRNSK